MDVLLHHVWKKPAANILVFGAGRRLCGLDTYRQQQSRRNAKRKYLPGNRGRGCRFFIIRHLLYARMLGFWENFGEK